MTAVTAVTWLQAALRVFHVTAHRELMSHDGYLVETADGLYLAAFPQPSKAVRYVGPGCVVVCGGDKLVYKVSVSVWLCITT